MIYASSVAAALEVFVLALLMFSAMAMAGSGSGAVIGLIPIVWFVVAVRIFVTLLLCSLFKGRTLRFVACGVVGCCFAFLFCLFFFPRAPIHESATLAFVMGATSMFAASMWRTGLNENEMICSKCKRVLSKKTHRCPWCYQQLAADVSSSDNNNG
jgi:uncharacterized membrane protein